MSPTTTLQVKAYIEVDFDFENPGLYLDRVSGSTSETREVFLMVRKPEEIEIVDITTSSPFLTARKLDFFEQKPDYARLKIEVTIKPGLPVGRFNETVTVIGRAGKNLSAALRVSGTVAGAVEVKPEALRFSFTGSERPGQGLVKKALITNSNEVSPLTIFSVGNPDGHLDLAFKPLIEGKKYELTATLKEEARARGTNLGGRIVVTTNDPEQREVIVNYNVLYTNIATGKPDKPGAPRRQ
jgi:hypothetical protein